MLSQKFIYSIQMQKIDGIHWCQECSINFTSGSNTIMYIQNFTSFKYLYPLPSFYIFEKSKWKLLIRLSIKLITIWKRYFYIYIYYIFGSILRVRCLLSIGKEGYGNSNIIRKCIYTSKTNETLTKKKKTRSKAIQWGGVRFWYIVFHAKIEKEEEE